MATTNPPTIAVTCGDPAGIGPEIVAHLFGAFRPAHSRALLIGAPAAFGHWREHFSLDVPVAGTLEEAFSDAETRVAILDTGVSATFEPGVESAGGGRHAGRAIEVACELAKSESVAAIVTAPISKKSLNLADFHYPGHTEMLAQYLNAPGCQMMMVAGGLRVVPMTRHVPIRDVAGAITEGLIVTCVRATLTALHEVFGVASPRIAVAALNPHAGDGGVIGDEEIEVIIPALGRLRDEGIDVTGPLPADAMFQSALVGMNDGAPPYDTYVTMYHDQGLVPFKMVAQRRGVNVTVGLPVIRTSVDHGTAFDIAGGGTAETGSLLEAYKLAESLASRL